MFSLYSQKIIRLVLIVMLLNMQILSVIASDDKPIQSTQDTPSQSGDTFIPGDGLFVNTFPDTTSFLHRSYSIDDQGIVDFPIIGRIKVSEMDSKQLEDMLKNEYRSYLKTPNVKVRPLIRVSVLGGVNNPGLFYVSSHSSLWDVLRIAGGTTLETGVKDLIWERNKNEISDNLIYQFERGISLSSMGFKSGDQLWTPSAKESFWDVFRSDVLPILAFATSVTFLYMTYQQNIVLRSR